MSDDLPIGLIVVAVILLGVAIAAASSQGTSRSAEGTRVVGSRQLRYAHAMIAVRSDPSDSANVVRQIEPGDSFYVQLKGDRPLWAPVVGENNDTAGFVLYSTNTAIKTRSLQAQRQIDSVADVRRKREADEARERARRSRAVLAQISRRRDDIQNITWYHAAGSESWSRFGVYAYVGEQGGVSSRWLRVKFGTRTDSWIFWDQVIFNVDGDVITFRTPRLEKDTDVGYGSVREVYDFKPSATDILNLRRISEGRNVKLRFRGEYVRDFTFPDSDKRRLAAILDFYDMGLEK